MYNLNCSAMCHAPSLQRLEQAMTEYHQGTQTKQGYGHIISPSPHSIEIIGRNGEGETVSARVCEETRKRDLPTYGACNA